MSIVTKSRPSLRHAIDATCKDCLYSPGEPGAWREQIERCTAADCPLYNVRPRATGAKVEKTGVTAEKTPQIREIAASGD